MLKFIASLPIHIYRWTLKPFMGHWCRFKPTCSEYGLEAIQKHGVLKGWALTLRRLAKCQPWGGSGFDSVPEPYQRLTLQVPNYNSQSGTHEIIVYEWGDAKAARTAICMHGITRNGHDFDILARHLVSKGYRVLCPTMAGRGESPRLSNPADYNSTNCTLDCLSLLDQMQLETVDWIGTSMGGIIGMNIASLHPERIRKLVLNDIGTLVRKEALQRIYMSMRETPAQFNSYEEANSYLSIACAGFGITDPDLWKLFASYSLTPLGNGAYRRSYDPAIIWPKLEDTKAFTFIQDVHYNAVWEKISAPVLILRGETSDILDAPTVEAMCASHAKAEAVIIQGVGHAPALMTRDQISLVTSWLLRM